MDQIVRHRALKFSSNHTSRWPQSPPVQLLNSSFSLGRVQGALEMTGTWAAPSFCSILCTKSVIIFWVCIYPSTFCHIATRVTPWVSQFVSTLFLNFNYTVFKCFIIYSCLSEISCIRSCFLGCNMLIVECFFHSSFIVFLTFPFYFSMFLVSYCSHLRPSMLQQLLRRLVFDVPQLNEYCKMPLKVNVTIVTEIQSTAQETCPVICDVFAIWRKHTR